MKPAACLFLLAFVGCSNDDGKHVQLQPDASIDGPPDAPPPHVIRIQTFGDAPLLMVYRDGSGPWQAPAAGDELHVTDAYELLAVCGDATFGYETAIERSTFDETGSMTFPPCFQSSSIQTTSVTVHGTMTQPGRVVLGAVEAEGTTTNWSFDLDVDTGTRDLVAIGAGRMDIRRDINVAGAMTLPNVDVMTGGAAMPQIGLTVNNTEPSDTLSTNLYLLTQNEFFSFAAPGSTTVAVAPPAELEVNDQQYLSVFADAQPAFRYVFGRYTGAASLTFTMMPKLTGIAFDATSVTFGTLPPHDAIELYHWAGANFAHVSATPGWLGSATKLAIDTSNIAGYKQEWQLGTIEARSFSAQRSESSLALQTGITEISPIIPQQRVRRDIANAQRLRRTIR